MKTKEKNGVAFLLCFFMFFSMNLERTLKRKSLIRSVLIKKRTLYFLYPFVIIKLMEVICLKILNFGSCNVDYVYSLDHMVAVGETETTYALNVFPGGKGLNQSIAIARAGSTVYHAGCIGEGGEFLFELLEANGVDVSFIDRVDEKSGHAIIQVNKEGDNAIFLYPGSNHMISTEQVDRVISFFDKGDILLLQNETSNFEYIIEKAYQSGMKIILNPSPFNERIRRIDFNMLSYLILNEIEAKEISGCETVQKALDYFKEEYPHLKIMLTLGSRGCVYQDSASQKSFPIFKVDVVDTTGAGDAFTGYFVSGIANGVEIDKILKTASCASAISVTREGAAVSIPYINEVMEKMPHMETNDADVKNEMLRVKIDEYIDGNLSEAALNELADFLGYSIIYTGALVKKITGQNFKSYLQKKRLKLAQELLTQTELSVDEIIKRVGYENASFFRKMFKGKYGTTPLNYRKRKVK